MHPRQRTMHYQLFSSAATGSDTAEMFSYLSRDVFSFFPPARDSLYANVIFELHLNYIMATVQRDKSVIFNFLKTRRSTIVSFFFKLKMF